MNKQEGLCDLDECDGHEDEEVTEYGPCKCGCNTSEVSQQLSEEHQ